MKARDCLPQIENSRKWQGLCRLEGASLPACTHRRSDTGVCTPRPCTYDCSWFDALGYNTHTHLQPCSHTLTTGLETCLSNRSQGSRSRNQRRVEVSGRRQKLSSARLSTDAFTIHYPQSSLCVCQKTKKSFSVALTAWIDESSRAAVVYLI